MHLGREPVGKPRRLKVARDFGEHARRDVIPEHRRRVAAPVQNQEHEEQNSISDHVLKPIDYTYFIKSIINRVKNRDRANEHAYILCHLVPPVTFTK